MKFTRIFNAKISNKVKVSIPYLSLSDIVQKLAQKWRIKVPNPFCSPLVITISSTCITRISTPHSILLKKLNDHTDGQAMWHYYFLKFFKPWTRWLIGSINRRFIWQTHSPLDSNLSGWTIIPFHSNCHEGKQF